MRKQISKKKIVTKLRKALTTISLAVSLSYYRVRILKPSNFVSFEQNASICQLNKVRSKKNTESFKAPSLIVDSIMKLQLRGGADQTKTFGSTSKEKSNPDWYKTDWSKYTYNPTDLSDAEWAEEKEKMALLVSSVRSRARLASLVKKADQTFTAIVTSELFWKLLEVHARPIELQIPPIEGISLLYLRKPFYSHRRLLFRMPLTVDNPSPILANFRFTSSLQS
jgi:hypothetical protein